MMRISTLLTVVAFVGLAGCSPEPALEREVRPAAIDPARVIDLTYSFNEQTIYWPNASGFTHRQDVWQMTDQGYWYAAGGFSADEHGGTHLDSPVHFSEGKQTVDQISVQKLVAPAVVIDVTASAAENRDYRATVQDVSAWEDAHGTIPADSIVLFKTGWGKFWPDRQQYFGSDVPGDTSNLHFPALSREVADLLVQRRVAGVGIDTASLDYGPSRDFIVHQVLNGANIYGLENVANLEMLPPAGATLIALPMKIEEGTGAPVRIIAILP